MATSTIYDVQVRYSVKDKASSGLDAIKGKALSASRATDVLKGALATIGGAGVLYAGKKAFIDFNSSIEQSNISLATQQQMFKGGTWRNAMKDATDLFGFYQEKAKASVGTTQDFLTMHQQIGASAYKAGLSMKQLQDMTVGATVATAALGERADVTSLDIKQMLAGTVSSRDRFAQMLLASQGKTAEEFNKMTQQARNSLVMNALNSPVLKNAAKEMEGSFAGVMSTFQDTLQITLGQAGLPLFKAITDELKGWNTWMTANPDKIKSMVSSLATGLKDAFTTVKSIVTGLMPILKATFTVVGSVAKFFASNADLMTRVAQAMLIYKGVGVATGIAGGIKTAAGGMGGRASGFGMALKEFGTAIAGMKNNTVSLGTRFASLATTLPGVVGGLGLLVTATAVLAEAFFGQTAAQKRSADRNAATVKTVDEFSMISAKIKDKERELSQMAPGFKEYDALKDNIEDLKAQRTQYKSSIYEKVEAAGGLEKTVGATGIDYKYNPNAMTGTNAVYAGTDKELTPQAFKALNEAMMAIYREETGNTKIKDDAIFGLARTFLGYSEKFTANGVSGMDTALNAPATPTKVDVNIHKIEVASADPDRFVMGAVSAFEEIVKNPVAAEGAMRGGF